MARAWLALSLLAALAAPAAAQTPYAAPYAIAPPGGVWTLPHWDRRATIVVGLSEPHRYRVCNDSWTLASVSTEIPAMRVDLPGRSCIDLAGRAITVTQPGLGIPPYGSYIPLD